MSQLLQTDSKIKKISSVLHRVILIGYSCYLFTHFGNNEFTYIQFIAICTYFIIFLILRRLDGWYSWLRLLIDYLFINLVVHFSTAPILYELTLCILPIINSPNHSGKKKSPWLLYSLVAITIYKVNDYKFDSAIVIMMITLLVTSVAESFRSLLINQTEAINSDIEEYLATRFGKKKVYRLYQKLIERLNSTNFFGFVVDNLVCFKLKDDKLVLINGSDFVWDYKFIEENEGDSIGVIKSSVANFVSIEINGSEYAVSIAIKDSSTADSTFIYVFNSNSSPNIKMIFKYFFVKLIVPGLNKISKLNQFERNMINIKREQKETLRKKYYYITNAQKAFHFLRNRLSPIDNYLAMVEDYEGQDEKDEELEEIIKSERKKIASSIKQIEQKANFILKKKNNPFSVSDVSKVNIKNIFAEIRVVAEDLFTTKSFTTTSNLNLYDLINSSVLVNIEGINILITDWMSNMEKYGESSYGASIEESDEFYFIIFCNNFDEKELNNIKSVAKNFNSDRKAEIFKRSSHGLSIMKSLIEQMNIGAEISVDEQKLLVYFTIELKKYHNEDISS